MSVSKKSAGQSRPESEHADQHNDGAQSAIDAELQCLLEAAGETEALVWVARYIASSTNVFNALDAAAMRDSGTRKALQEACPFWRDPDAVSGQQEAWAWLMAELHNRMCLISDTARTVENLRRQP